MVMKNECGQEAEQRSGNKISRLSSGDWRVLYVRERDLIFDVFLITFTTEE